MQGLSYVHMRFMGSLARAAISFSLGCLIYSCVRGLQTYISIGAPFVDWSWYLLIIAALVWLLLRMGFRAVGDKLWLGGLAVLFAFLAIGFGAFGYHFALPMAQSPNPPITFWAAADVNYFSNTVLDDVKNAGGILYIAIDSATFKEPSTPKEFVGQINLATEQGIQIVLLPPVSDFLSAPVHEEWITNTQLAMTFARENNLPITGFIADAEPPLNKSWDVFGFGASEVKRAEQNTRHFLESAQSTVPQFKQEVTSIFPLFADGFDDDNDLAILLQSPVDPPGNWSLLNLQAYTSYMPEESRTYYLWLAHAGDANAISKQANKLSHRSGRARV